MTAELPAWISDPHIAGVWARVRVRFEASGLVPDGRTLVTLESRDQRHALAGLLGRPVNRDRVSIDLSMLDARLRERSGVGGLAAVLPLVTPGPLVDRPDLRTQQRVRREQPLDLALRLIAAPWAEEWVAGLRRTGLLTARDDAELLVRHAAGVLCYLSDAEPQLRSRVELAAHLVGDAHALDDDRLLSRVVLRGLAAAAGCPPPQTPNERRTLWERFQVAPDLVSTTCLTLGLRPVGDDAVSRRIRLATESGDPLHLTGRDLRRWTGAVVAPAHTRVLVCENPRILEAVAESWGGDVPVVCTAGEPNTVVTGLLERLTSAGGRLAYHGDFDWPGVAIANRLVTRFSVEPWLMSASDYETAVRPGNPPLSGAPVDPVWDAELGAAMRLVGRAVHEESVGPQLVAALAAL